MESYYSKYCKYKNKYIETKKKINLRNQIGSAATTETPIDLTNIKRNIDGKNNHINATVQNIVLTFGPEPEGWEGLGLTVGEIIAQNASVGFDTQSATWCPLIWIALGLCYPEISSDLTNIPPSYQSNVSRIPDGGEDKLRELARQLSEIPNWCKFAVLALSKSYGSIPSGSNEFGHPFVLEQVEEIKRELN